MVISRQKKSNIHELMQKTSEGANIPGIRSVGKINQCVIITITEKTGLEFIFVDIYI